MDQWTILMKAFQFKSYEGLQALSLAEIEIPEIGDNEILIKVKAGSINDWDWGMIHGYPWVIKLLFGWSKPKKIQIPGTDVAGIVEEVGKNIKHFKKGDRVFGDLSDYKFGAFAEFCLAREVDLHRIPDSMDFKTAAALPHASALMMQGLMDEIDIQQGMKVLVNGAGGGVGMMAIQLLKKYEIEITGVDSEEKKSQMLEWGYHKTLNYKKEDYTELNEKYDFIFDVKTKKSISEISRALKKGGKFVTVGGDLDKIFSITLFAPLRSIFTKKSLKVLSLKPNAGMERVIELCESGELQILTDSTYQFKDIPLMLKKFGDATHTSKMIYSID